MSVVIVLSWLATPIKGEASTVSVEVLTSTVMNRLVFGDGLMIWLVVIVVAVIVGLLTVIFVGPAPRIVNVMPLLKFVPVTVMFCGLGDAIITA